MSSNTLDNNISYAPYVSTKADPSINYCKAALYISIATVAALAFALLLTGGGVAVVLAGFMFSIGLPLDAVAILAGTLILTIIAGAMAYKTYSSSIKAHHILNPHY